MTTQTALLSIAVGLITFAIGEASKPLLKRLWAHMNKPEPLTPQLKGHYLTQLAFLEAEHERLNYLNTNNKELFLMLFGRLFQVIASSTLIGILVIFIAVGRQGYITLFQVPTLLLLVLVLILSLSALLDASRLLEKNFVGRVRDLQEQIDKLRGTLDQKH